MYSAPAISAIETRIVELMQERTALAEQVRAVTMDIHTLESAKRILDGNRAALRPAKPKATNDSAMPALERGAFTRAVLEVLRDARRPLTVMETGQATLARLGLPEDAMTKSTLSKKVITTTTIHVRKGTLRRVDVVGEPLRLEVAR